jgi:hypothetical protein
MERARMTDTPGKHFETPRFTVDAARRRRVIDTAYRCLAKLVSHIACDHEHCGKAACARSRRCRGFACEPDWR